MPEHWIDKLFARLAARYGHRWGSVYPTAEALMLAKAEWRIELSRVKPETIELALHRLKEAHPSWPPNVFEFARLCAFQPADFSLPNAKDAWLIVCAAHRVGTHERRWRHPVIFAAARDPRLDLFNLRLLLVDQAVKHWAPVYSEYIQRFAAGEIFEWPEEKAIEDKSGKAVTKEEKAAARARGLEKLQALKSAMRTPA